MFYWILFRNNAMSYKSKVFLTTLLYFSPLWFYYKWTHPEVYTFTFLMIGLIDYYNKRKASAIFFTAMSSLQNPAAAIVPFFMMIKEIVVLCKNFSKTALYKFISYGLISLTVFIPYMFYYYHFNTFSLIGKYATDIHSISFAKIFSLFFDLNFGLIIYAPVIFLLAIYGTIKKDKLAISSLFIVILFAVIDAAQLNWNPGIQLIHRYSYWMIPVLLFGSFNIIKQFTDKTKCIILIINAILILPWFIYTTTSHAVSQVRFQPVAKTVLNTFPQLYNPQEEIFAERAFGEEGVLGDKENLPISYYENDKILKSLHYDIEKNKYYYKNYNQNLLDLKIKIKHKQYIYYVGLKGIKKELKNEKIHKTSEN